MRTDGHETEYRTTGVYRCGSGILAVNRHHHVFPSRCLISGETGDLTRIVVTVPLWGRSNVLSTKAKKPFLLAVCRVIIGRIAGGLPGIDLATQISIFMDEALGLRRIPGWNRRFAYIDVNVSQTAYQRWVQRNRRPVKWFLYLLLFTTVCFVLGALSLLLAGEMKWLWLLGGFGFFVLGIIGVNGILVSFALLLVMGNRRILDLVCFDDDWAWVKTQNQAFVDSLDVAPFPEPRWNGWWNRYERPGDCVSADSR